MDIPFGGVLGDRWSFVVWVAILVLVDIPFGGKGSHNTDGRQYVAILVLVDIPFGEGFCNERPQSPGRVAILVLVDIPFGEAIFKREETSTALSQSLF